MKKKKTTALPSRALRSSLSCSPLFSLVLSALLSRALPFISIASSFSHLDLGDELDRVVPHPTARGNRGHLDDAGALLLDGRRGRFPALHHRRVEGASVCGRGRGFGFGLCGPGRGCPFPTDVLAVGGPQQHAFAGSVESATVVRDSQVAPFPSFGVGRPVGRLSVGVVEHEVGVGLVGQSDSDVLAALVDLPGLALELEDCQVAVAFEHQARGVVGRADELVDE